MKIERGSVVGRLTFIALEMVGIISVIIMMCIADSEPSKVLKAAIVLTVATVVSLLTALLLDDPNRLLRHVVAIYSVLVASIGHILFPKNRKVNIVRRRYLKCGSYSELYKCSLFFWDVLKYNEPTSIYFYGIDGPSYDRYHLKNVYDKIFKHSNKITSFDEEVRRRYSVSK